MPIDTIIDRQQIVYICFISGASKFICEKPSSTPSLLLTFEKLYKVTLYFSQIQVVTESLPSTESLARGKGRAGPLILIHVPFYCLVDENTCEINLEIYSNKLTSGFR